MLRESHISTDGVIAMTRTTFCLYIATFSLFAAGAAQAQATRTWVSGTGDDVNPCSRTAPCKTFAGAISKTAAGGEIDALDPAGYGAVTVTKSMTIDGGSGQVGSILVIGTNGVTVNAGANDVVTIRNISFQGLAQSTGPAGTNGIQLLNGKSLHVEHCTIQNFGGNGINIVSSTGAKVFVDDTVSRGNTGNGLNIVATNTNVRVSVTNSNFSDNSNGIFSGDFSTTTVSNSEASGNALSGFAAFGNGGAATLNLTNSTATNNLTSGISAGGGSATSQVRMSNVTVASNSAGLVIGSNGTIVSFGNNHNTGTGAPNASMNEQ
jgi:hypothetical protein